MNADFLSGLASYIISSINNFKKRNKYRSLVDDDAIIKIADANRYASITLNCSIFNYYFTLYDSNYINVAISQRNQPVRMLAMHTFTVDHLRNDETFTNYIGLIMWKAIFKKKAYDRAIKNAEKDKK